MRQAYYGVNSTFFDGQANEIARFNELTRKLFKTGLEKEQELALMSEREALKGAIQSQLSDHGTLLGFLSLEQIEEVEAAVQSLPNDDNKMLLGSNRIPYARLEEAIGALAAVEQTEPVANLIFFLERAKQNKQHVIVWMM
ncbi:hypothetical protein [Paenibacillus sp. PL91]|uniref:hypothetical protein n=1 Tax=Paenibacillus sp. PL91 TaxID=2729538 RepID=UPI00145E8E2B|nr:hypothetical protein [Paenibacillus sp. PL91]MBC9203662.1 hypothetical protein [Paenibacillus sp. PL91]